MVDVLKDWVYDDVYKCSHCESEFAVLNPEEFTINFCPSCASRDINSLEEE